MELLFLCMLSLLACPSSARTVMEALSSRFDLITFTNFLRSTHVDTVLDKGNHMVLVPTDKALNLIPASYMSMLHDTTNTTSNPHMLSDLVKYHIVPYTGNLSTKWTGNKLQTMLLEPIRIVDYEKANTTIVNGVVMTDARMPVSNGHIYLIDGVLSPPHRNVYYNLLHDERFSTFLSAVNLAGMRHRLEVDKITVFAPTNDAFEKMDRKKYDVLFNSHADLQAFVQLHILHGIYFTNGLYPSQPLKMVSDNGYHVQLLFHKVGALNMHFGPIAVVQPDWLAHNGVIQVIGGVILPSQRCINWV